jgi:hypothetical protein
VEVTDTELKGLDLTNFEFNYDLLESLTASGEAFREFVDGHWKNVLQAAFVYQLQPLDPNLETCILFVHAAPDGKARKNELDTLLRIRDICSRQHLTVGAFATDADSGYDPAHEKFHAELATYFHKGFDVPLLQKFRPISDILHILKRARYWMLKNPPMVIGMDPTAPALDVQVLRDLFRGDLPSIVFCDDPITKMHDSLPMVLFRFECLVKLHEAKQLGWFTYFFPWVLINEAMSHKKARTADRLGWFRLAYVHMMKCLDGYYAISAAPRFHPGMVFTGRKTAPPDSRRPLFNRKLLMHASDSVASIIFEIKTAKHPISLQRLMTTPVEKKFGVTRVHAGTHQTMEGLLSTMEQDEAMKFAYALQHVKNRRLAYGETVEPCPGEDWGLAHSPIWYIENLLLFVGFPCQLLTIGAFPVPYLADQVEMLISDELLPFAKTNFSAMSRRKRRSLYQELGGVITSSRRIILSSKSEMGRVVSPSNPIEKHLAKLLGRPRVLSHELKVMTEQVCETAHVVFEGPCSLQRSPKRDVLHWIEANWADLGQLFISIAANQVYFRPPQYEGLRHPDYDDLIED